jgi:Zn-dependent metalloprotease
MHPQSVICRFVPPYFLKKLARNTDKSISERALSSWIGGERIRGRREILARVVLPLRGTGKNRAIYDARNGSELPGVIVRQEGDPATGDVAVNEVYDGLGVTYDFFYEVFGRNSLDDRGMRLDATVHFGREFMDAFWDGRQMIFGDSDGEDFTWPSKCLDVIAHELTHGIIQFTSGLEYKGQSGALSESMSDVFGSLVKQWSLGQTADEADWLIGAEVLAPGVKADALRSMKAPGTAYENDLLGQGERIPK